MANLIGLAKALNERLPYKKTDQDRILKQLLTKEELNSFNEGFYVVQNGEVKEVQGNATRPEYRFLALGNKIAIDEPVFSKGFYIFYAQDEKLTKDSKLLLLRKFGYRYFNDEYDSETIVRLAEEWLSKELGLDKAEEEEEVLAAEIEEK